MEVESMICVKLKQVAEAKKMSRTRLSRISDVNYKTINAIWNAPCREVTTTTLDKLSVALGVHVCELLEQIPDDAI